MTDPQIIELLRSVKQDLDHIKDVLGIGKIVPSRVVDIKLHAKRKAQEIMDKKKGVDNHNRL